MLSFSLSLAGDGSRGSGGKERAEGGGPIEQLLDVISGENKSGTSLTLPNPTCVNQVFRCRKMFPVMNERACLNMY